VNVVLNEGRRTKKGYNFISSWFVQVIRVRVRTEFANAMKILIFMMFNLNSVISCAERFYDVLSTSTL
jgi:hypothetical protein